jgi:hypothetical protein
MAVNVYTTISEIIEEYDLWTATLQEQALTRVGFVSNDEPQELQNKVDDNHVFEVKLPEGSMVLFSSLQWHCSGCNRSDKPRRVFYAQYSTQPICVPPSATGKLRRHIVTDTHRSESMPILPDSDIGPAMEQLYSESGCVLLAKKRHLELEDDPSTSGSAPFQASVEPLCFAVSCNIPMSGECGFNNTSSTMISGAASCHHKVVKCTGNGICL